MHCTRNVHRNPLATYSPKRPITCIMKREHYIRTYIGIPSQATLPRGGIPAGGMCLQQLSNVQERFVGQATATEVDMLNAWIFVKRRTNHCGKLFPENTSQHSRPSEFLKKKKWRKKRRKGHAGWRDAMSCIRQDNYDSKTPGNTCAPES